MLPGASVEDWVEEKTVGTALSPVETQLPSNTSHSTADQLFGSRFRKEQASDIMATIAGLQTFPGEHGVGDRLRGPGDS